MFHSVEVLEGMPNRFLILRGEKEKEKERERSHSDIFVAGLVIARRYREPSTFLMQKTHIYSSNLWHEKHWIRVLQIWAIVPWGAPGPGLFDGRKLYREIIR